MTGIRILIVEDEFLLGCSLEEDLRSAGFDVSGPFTTLAAALDASRREKFDLAILDVNLSGEKVYPVADDLMARGVPFLFLSGYAHTHLPERFRGLPQVGKPYDPENLVKEIRRVSVQIRR
jgi:DNA-binding response OmpR family regulator